MSLRRAFRRVAKVGLGAVTGFATGGIGGAAAGAAGVAQQLQQQSLMPIGPAIATAGRAGAEGLIGLMGRVLPGAGAIGGAVAAGGAVLRGAGAAARAANAWCGRNPAWCVSVGGLPAVIGMVQSGQLPLVKHRRRRGLSARDLRGFYKTSRLMRRVAGTIGLRRGGGARGRGTSSTMITQN